MTPVRIQTAQLLRRVGVTQPKPAGVSVNRKPNWRTPQPHRRQVGRPVLDRRQNRLILIQLQKFRQRRPGQPKPPSCLKHRSADAGVGPAGPFLFLVKSQLQHMEQMQRNRGQLRLRTSQRTLLAQYDFRIGLPVAQKLGDIFHHIQPVIAQRKLQPVRPGIALAVLHMEQGRFQTHGLFFFQPQTWRRTHPKMRQQLLHRGGGTIFRGNQRRWRQIPGHCAVAACLRRVIVPPVALDRF